MKKRKLTIVLTFLISFIIISNTYSHIYIGFLDGGISKRYHFETYDGIHKFTTMPGKGLNVQSMEYGFVNFCKENPEYLNTKLYRTFRRNPLKYWRWYEFVTHPRYKYKYKQPSKNNFEYFKIKVQS